MKIGFSSLFKLPDKLLIPVFAGLAAGSLAGVAVIALPNTYASLGRVLPPTKNLGPLGNLASLANNLGVEMLSAAGADSGEATYVEILESHWLRERLLAQTFHFKVQRWRLGPAETRDCSLFQFLDEPNEDRALGRLDRAIQVAQDLKTRSVSIRVETTSPELSQAIVKSCIGLLDTFLQERGQTSGGNKAEFTRQRLEESRLNEQEAETALLRFTETNKLYLTSLDPSVRLQGMRLENNLRIKNQLTGMHILAHEQALLEEKNNVPVLNILDNGNYPYEKSGPPRLAWTVLAALFGGGLGLAYACRARLRIAFGIQTGFRR
jgi:uncharacterized protein involved in exopolysaccharide biosynthesis